ncbi:MAG: hypothetical protein K9J16_05545 [Melioribacteraceae bacterium]|nr:hypothetical protein [Melioribacteraceae bacterium]MCF8353263.1 hypothetical protein [Melioribacteraceae bacterium]MCF8395577.1 hypothetical protein [Melioribacteraceae bacterium]MCF8418790.1 hypothetical protein [Melioribacteraceae bacterium]
MEKKIQILHDNWKFSLSKKSRGLKSIPNRIIKPGEWFDAFVPGTIHTDLLRNGIIDDPYYSDNESRLEWIAKNDWVYKTEFDINDANKKYNLIFDGIDTVADIFLNGKKIHFCENMFLRHKISIGRYLVKGKNELTVYFFSPVRYSIKKEKHYGKIPVELNSYRAYIRKAQYSFGWDWGPSFPTSGIWKNVYLETPASAEIVSFGFSTLKITKSKARVKVTAKIRSKKKNRNRLAVKLGEVEKQVKIYGDGDYNCELSVHNPKLWFPKSEGEPNVYNLTLILLDGNDNEIDSINKKVGIRTIELITKEKKENTFKLRINNKDIYAKGVNWIPADSFLPRIEKEKYLKLLSFVQSANMNIIRVWGGGIYESDYFYELCDELGLLVWQDFMFACGAYPEHKEFIENVKKEVDQNITRLQYHPSIALWCGNNENEWIWFQKQKSSYKEMPGYKIYHDIIPSMLKKLDPLCPYHPSSPFGEDKDPNSFNSGNTHQWGIWSNWIDYEKVSEDRSLFVSEFGFQGPANKGTMEKIIPSENQFLFDRIFEFHNKQVEGPERIWKFLSAHLPITTSWDDYFYLAQLNQAFALKTCLEHWRTNGRTNGSIIWQLNDSWQVTSWSIIDYELKPKIAYHFVKEILSAQIIFFIKKNDKIIAKIQNQGDAKFIGTYKLYFIDTYTGRIEKQISNPVTVGGSETIDIESISSGEYFSNENSLLFAELENDSGEIISSNYFSTSPWKYLKMQIANVSLQLDVNPGVQRVIVSTDKPAFFVDLYSKGIEFDKRGFTVIPGKEIVVNILNKVDHLDLDDIKIFSLNKFLSRSK